MTTTPRTPQPLSADQLAEVRSLDLLALMPEQSAAVVSGHLAALLAENTHFRAAIDRAVESLDYAWRQESAPSTRARLQAIRDRLHVAARTEVAS